MAPALLSPDDYDPAKMRHPTPEEKEQELRLYYIARADALPSTGGLCRLASKATWLLLKQARALAPDLYEGYWNAPAQPKICLKVKNAGQMMRALEAVGDTPHVTLHDASQAPLFAAFGPTSRAMMADHLRKLQILNVEAPASGVMLPFDTPAIDAPCVWLYVRSDVGTPYGKLAAQAGHGTWAALKQLLATNANAPMIEDWDAAGNPVVVKTVPDLSRLTEVQATARALGLNAAFIVDAGRTAFKEPTATVIGFGPVAKNAMPPALLDFPDLP